MNNQEEFERNLAVLIVEFNRRGVSNQQIRDALQGHASILDSAEMPTPPEQDFSFRKRIRASVPPDDQKLAAEVEAAIGAQLDVVGAECGLRRYPIVA